MSIGPIKPSNVQSNQELNNVLPQKSQEYTSKKIARDTVKVSAEAYAKYESEKSQGRQKELPHKKIGKPPNSPDKQGDKSFVIPGSQKQKAAPTGIPRTGLEDNPTSNIAEIEKQNSGRINSDTHSQIEPNGHEDRHIERSNKRTEKPSSTPKKPNPEPQSSPEPKKPKFIPTNNPGTRISREYGMYTMGTNKKGGKITTNA